MNRIVNLRNLQLSRKKESRGELVVSTLATTYRYKEKDKGKK
jgi:Tfp pilus assembly protein PilO